MTLSFFMKCLIARPDPKPFKMRDFINYFAALRHITYLISLSYFGGILMGVFWSKKWEVKGKK